MCVRMSVLAARAAAAARTQITPLKSPSLA